MLFFAFLFELRRYFPTPNKQPLTKSYRKNMETYDQVSPYECLYHVERSDKTYILLTGVADATGLGVQGHRLIYVSFSWHLQFNICY